MKSTFNILIIILLISLSKVNSIIFVKHQVACQILDKIVNPPTTFPKIIAHFDSKSPITMTLIAANYVTSDSSMLADLTIIPAIAKLPAAIMSVPITYSEDYLKVSYFEYLPNIPLFKPECHDGLICGVYSDTTVAVDEINMLSRLFIMKPFCVEPSYGLGITKSFMFIPKFEFCSHHDYNPSEVVKQDMVQQCTSQLESSSNTDPNVILIKKLAQRLGFSMSGR